MKHKNRGIYIKLNDRDNSSLEAFDRVLGKFKKKLKLSGILLEYREKSYFVKPSDKKRKKRLANKRKKK